MSDLGSHNRYLFLVRREVLFSTKNVFNYQSNYAHDCKVRNNYNASPDLRVMQRPSFLPMATMRTHLRDCFDWLCTQRTDFCFGIHGNEIAPKNSSVTPWLRDGRFISRRRFRHQIPE